MSLAFMSFANAKIECVQLVKSALDAFKGHFGILDKITGSISSVKTRSKTWVRYVLGLPFFLTYCFHESIG